MGPPLPALDCFRVNPASLCLSLSLSPQRWNPVDGFSERLLPSDRWQWSDVTGLQHQPLDSFRLPSSSWEWEGDWYVDENFEGEPTENAVSVFHTVPLSAPFTSRQSLSCVSAGMDLRHRLPSHLHQRQEVELLCPSQAMAPPQEVCGHGLLG